MTLEEAAKVLNQFKYHHLHWFYGHRETVEWAVNHPAYTPTNLVLIDSAQAGLGVETLDEFTAIAVAEKYRREQVIPSSYPLLYGSPGDGEYPMKEE